ncbi:hypothetical protein TpMuguga_04g00181 [Theileria parva strain Muguga]|uniref:Uncharacterized protein n=1 Tax=Theileria parva TaxID=5875 RepID=Q4N306_THEPA|nr:uncharacterized protein TpMuguga_04g00181 [Theileria parva strain Muguga]EAN31533.1 hypothetical protein TpMuguga_04g00181 [Theileria parva strain Muguga]|eukprot:XP_763816.1 hypothetical protein [Theileria parva strain Muguga]
MTQLSDSVKKDVESSEKVSQRVRDTFTSRDETDRTKEQYSQSRDKKSDDSPSESSERSSRDKSREAL